MAQVGTSGSDTLTGGILGDDLSGLAGNDWLDGKGANDVIDGGAGNDTLIGGSGTDTASYASATAGVTVSLAIGSAQNTGGAGSDDLASFENLLGSGFADSLTGSSGDNLLEGGSGNDWLQGGLGNDTLDGGAGTDTASYSGYAPVGGVGVKVSLALATAQITNAGTDVLAAIENLTGSSGTDTLTGSTANNVLRGGLGTDFLAGGEGDDTLYGAGSGTPVSGSFDGDYDGGAGNDWVSFSDAPSAIVLDLSFAGNQDMLGDGVDVYDPSVVNIENAEGSIFDDFITGSSAANYLLGIGGNDTLLGDAGNDTLSGGAGLDYASYAGNLSAVTVDLSLGTATGVGAGSDTLVSIEGAIGTSSADLLTGSSVANGLIGGFGNDTLSGAAGSDTLYGGPGNDLIDGGTGTDIASYAGAGSGVTVSLAVASGQATGLGTDTLVGVEGLEGSGFADLLTGSSGANSIYGLAGNDTLSGGAGSDVLDGGAGSDTVSYADATAGMAINLNRTDGQLTAGSGIETLANFEVLVGSAFNDTLTGLLGGDDTVASTDGLSKVYGGAGNDYLTTGGGYFNGLLLDELRGEAGNDTLDATAGTGFAEFNSMLMSGGDGDDTYIIGNAGRQVVSEAGGSGIDTVRLSGVVPGDEGTTSGNFLAYALAAGVENFVAEASTTVDLSVTGNNLDNLIVGGASSGLANVDVLDGGTGNDTLVGGAGRNELHGSDGNDRLLGGTESDALFGESGTDTLAGGAGDDDYYVEGGSDLVVESAGQGIDTVWYTGSASYTLAEGSQVENAGIYAGATPAFIRGNSAANTVYGNSGGNLLIGGGGADTLIGSSGDDTYQVDSVDDQVVEFSLEGIDRIVSSIDYVEPNNDFVEELAAESGTGNLSLTGNASANRLFGNDGNNALNGAGGNDTLDGGDGDDTLDGGTSNDLLVGGAGDDSYVLASGVDTVTEDPGAGTDTVLLGTAVANYTLGANLETLVLGAAAVAVATGNAGDNRIAGNNSANALDGGEGNDTLDGGAGADSLAGGLGDDTFVVDSAGDLVSDAGGTDTLRFGANALALDLTAIADGQFTGIDRIDMRGMGGNTLGLAAAEVVALGATLGTLVVNGEAGDTVNLGGIWNAPTPQVIDTVSYAVYTNAGAEVVKVQDGITVNVSSPSPDQVLTGTAGADLLAGGEGNDTLVGQGGNDTLVGGTGTDSLIGGGGNDTYDVDNAGDAIVELTGGGTDTVKSSLAYSLGANVEKLTLTGGAAVNGTGNPLNNTLTGNGAANALSGLDGNDALAGGSGVDSLLGGLGNDTLTGNGGNDKFVFDTAPGASGNLDTIADFTAGDKIWLDNDAFAKLGAVTTGTKALPTGQFPVDGIAHDSNDFILYNAGTGALYYDQDGSLAVFAPVQFAVLANKPVLASTDFQVID